MDTFKKILKVLKGASLRLLSIQYAIVASVLYVVLSAFFLASMVVFAVTEWIFTGGDETTFKILDFWLDDLRNKLIDIFLEMIK